jgi:hypothetical protein
VMEKPQTGLRQRLIRKALPREGGEKVVGDGNPS